MLIDRGNPQALRQFGTALLDLDPTDAHVGAAVRRQNARNRLDQGALAGAVFPEQRMHLARPQRERDVGQRLHPRKSLAQPGDGKQQF